MRLVNTCIAVFLLLVLTGGVEAQNLNSLTGSLAKVERAYSVALSHDFSFLESPSRVRRFEDLGLLVRLSGNSNYRLNAVSYPLVRPEVKLFVERISAQYRGACGERLVVTSATRPENQQPRNASQSSVHPTGMAVDFRRPSGRCRAWLEENLITLQQRGVALATLERSPPHYHVVIFPQQYSAYVAARLAGERVHTVRSGDTLGEIAEEYGTSVSRIMEVNSLRTTTIRPGQRIQVPAD